MAKATDRTEGILPFSALDPQAQQLVEQVCVTGCPLVITRDGQPAVVLIEARAFEEQQQRLALMERIIHAEKDLAEGRTHTQEEVEALLDEWLGDGAQHSGAGARTEEAGVSPEGIPRYNGIELNRGG